MPDKYQDRFALAAVALHGMCVGGTVVANLLEDASTEVERESQKKSAKEIAKSAVMLADSVLEILDGSPV